MATYYVSSVSGDDSDGLSWATAKTSIAGGLALATASGDIVYVDSAHSKTQGASIAYTPPTAGTRVSILSVNRNGSTTTGHSGWLAGATETVTDFNAGIGFCSANENRSLYCYGLKVYATGNNGATINILTGANANGTTPSNVELDSCTLAPTGSGSNVTFSVGTSQGSFSDYRFARIRNCEIIIHNNSSGNAFSIAQAHLEMIGCTISYGGANKPAALFGFNSTCGGRLTAIDCDLSGYEKSGGAYFDASGLSGPAVLINCKLSATPSLVTGSYPNNVGSITLVNVDSGDTHNVFEFRNRLGTLTESDSIYAGTGAEFDGAGVSWQIVTTSACNEHEYFTTPWLHRWSEDTAEITASLEIAHDSATDLTDRNAWAEFEYLGNASFPLGTLATGRNACPFDGTAVDWPNSSESWTGTGGFSNENKQTLAETFTTAEKSLLRARFTIAEASKTLYLDPVLRISGASANPAVRWLDVGAVIAEPHAGGGTGSIFSSPIIRGAL